MLKHEKIDDLRVMYNILQRVKTDGIEAMKNVSTLKDHELLKFKPNLNHRLPQNICVSKEKLSLKKMQKNLLLNLFKHF